MAGDPTAVSGAPSLAGRSIIITGAGAGIGAATARLAARQGARLTLADLDRDAGAAVAAAIERDGGAAQFVVTDISDEAAVAALVAAAVRRFGPLHAAFNNAAVPSYSHTDTAADFAEMPAAAMHRSLAVNVMGTFFCMQHEIRAMLATGGGAIVNTASNVGVLAIPQAADYIASKHAVIGLTKSAALDYAKRNIRVNAVLPGVTRSRMMEESFAKNPELVDWAKSVQPNGRIADAEEIGQAALWLLSDAASFVTGISMHVDGGYSIV